MIWTRFRSCLFNLFRELSFPDGFTPFTPPPRCTPFRLFVPDPNENTRFIDRRVQHPGNNIICLWYASPPVSPSFMASPALLHLNVCLRPGLITYVPDQL